MHFQPWHAAVVFVIPVIIGLILAVASMSQRRSTPAPPQLNRAPLQGLQSDGDWPTMLREASIEQQSAPVGVNDWPTTRVPPESEIPTPPRGIYLPFNSQNEQARH